LPDTAAPDGDRLILSGLFTNAVAVWNPATQGIEAYYDTFAAPANAIRFDGDLIIAELGAGRVTRFDQATETSHSWDGFIVPTGLAATADDLYAADWATGILYRLVQDGTSLDTSQVVVTGLMGPEGLAATADGDLVVVETWTRQLSLIDLAASPATVTPLVTGLDVGQLAPAGMAPFWAFDGVAVGPSGEIYVSANGIYRYELR
jgi:sugar lactone lactonase YvrE